MKFQQNLISDTKDLTVYEVLVDYSELKPIYENVYSKKSKSVKVQGFRPGKAPRSKIESMIYQQVLDESINTLAISTVDTVIRENTIHIVDVPSISFKSIDEEKGITFEFSYIKYPEVVLGDFKSISIIKNNPEVPEEEVDKFIVRLIKTSLPKEEISKHTKIIKDTPEDQKKDESEVSTENKSETRTKYKREVEEFESMTFELNDNLIKALNYEGQSTLEEMRIVVKNKLLQSLIKESEDKYNVELLQNAIKVCSFEIPDLFIDETAEKEEEMFTSRLNELGLSLKSFLDIQNDTIEARRDKWREDAVFRVSVDLVLMKIASVNGLLPSEEEIMSEIDKIEDPKVRRSYENKDAKLHVKSNIARNRSMEWLRAQVQK